MTIFLLRDQPFSFFLCATVLVGCGARTPLSVEPPPAPAPAETSVPDPGMGAPGTIATGIAELVAGYFHTCARWNDGLVRCWGDDEFGQLGDGGSSATCLGSTGAAACQRTPHLVGGLPVAAHVTAGGNHTCVLGADGTVWCWGANDEGQLGLGSTGPFETTPSQVPGLTGVSALAAGGEHTCARVTDGTVYCWGYNDLGQLGDGTGNSRATPAPVLWLNAATGNPSNTGMLTLGRYSSCELETSGSALCWGQYWTLAGDTMPAVLTPAQVGGVIIDLGMSLDTTCVVLADGEMWCSAYGGPDPACGDNGPAPNVGIWGWQFAQGATKVAMGDAGWCVRASDGSVYCNGYTGFGCGSPPWPPVAGVSEAVTVAAGYGHACALRADQTVQCWGDDSFGQLGHGEDAVALDDAGLAPPEFVTW
jgi:hypothetical protein